MCIISNQQGDERMKINYDEVKTLKSFYGVKLRGNESFSELLKIEQDYKDRIKEQEANIQRIDAQTKGVKW